MSLKVLVACEFSGAVRDAFIQKGHRATSVDLIPSESDSGPHISGDVLDLLGDGWDLMVAHPPCTYLALAGNRWRKGQEKQVKAAMDFAEALWKAPIKHIALEQPRSTLGQRIGRMTQTIHPYQFGVPEFKTTWLWLKGLPPLQPTEHIKPPAFGTKEHDDWSRVHRAAPGPMRWKERSRTFPAIAAAMADQWGMTTSAKDSK